MASMKRLFDSRNLWSKPNCLIFPSFINANTSISKPWFRLRLKSLCSKAGLNSRLYSGHSLRSGGATDLFNAGVDFHFIKLLGRWKSDTALIYYRDRVGMRNAAFKGFSKIAKRH